MGKMIITFLAFTVAFAIMIIVFRDLTKRDRWHLTKCLGFSILCAILSVITLSIIIFLF